MTPEQRARIHIFSPFFYNRLSVGPAVPQGCVAVASKLLMELRSLHCHASGAGIWVLLVWSNHVCE
jgi:hypothetical protein